MYKEIKKYILEKYIVSDLHVSSIQTIFTISNSVEDVYICIDYSREKQLVVTKRTVYWDKDIGLLEESTTHKYTLDKKRDLQKFVELALERIDTHA